MASPWNIPLDKLKQKHNAPGYFYPFPNINVISKKNLGCRGGMVAPWRNTLAISISRSNDKSKNLGWRGGMVAAWRNTLANSKQKQNAPFPQ